jgi:hypothetical protein
MAVMPLAGSVSLSVSDGSQRLGEIQFQHAYFPIRSRLSAPAIQTPAAIPAPARLK